MYKTTLKQVSCIRYKLLDRYNYQYANERRCAFQYEPSDLMLSGNFTYLFFQHDHSLSIMTFMESVSMQVQVHR